jgi:hypothetical protein
VGNRLGGRGVTHGWKLVVEYVGAACTTGEILEESFAVGGGGFVKLNNEQGYCLVEHAHTTWALSAMVP